MLGSNVLLLLLATGISAGLVNRQGNSECAHWCKDNFPSPGSDCTSLAAKGGGPCYECGAKATDHYKKLCNGMCTNTKTDSKNCGSCGNK
ncbi:hypothetical protein QWA68_016353, partial [Fusarium oxysporum]